MYLNRVVLLVAFVSGILGLGALAQAVAEYRGAVHSFTQVEIALVPDSIVWDAGHARCSFQIELTNRSSATVIAEYVDLQIFADGVFAGADYDAWRPLAVAGGSSERRRVTVLVSISGQQEHVLEAQLSIRGEVRWRFNGVERPFAQRVRLELGRIADMPEQRE